MARNTVPVQMALFPCDEEEQVLLAQGSRYAALPDVAQSLVRAYIRMLREGNGTRQADWIRTSDLPSSTAHDAIRRHQVELWPAIQEACQLLGVRGAAFGGLALVAAGVRLFEDLTQGRRSTSSLTPVERDIMRDCAAMAGVRLGGGMAVEVTSPDGTRISAAAAVAGEDEARQVLAALRERTGRIRKALDEAEAADSGRATAAAVGADRDGVDRGDQVEIEGSAEAAPGWRMPAEGSAPALPSSPSSAVIGTAGEAGGEAGEAGGEAGGAESGPGVRTVIERLGVVLAFLFLSLATVAPSSARPSAGLGGPVAVSAVAAAPSSERASARGGAWGRPDFRDSVDILLRGDAIGKNRAENFAENSAGVGGGHLWAHTATHAVRSALPPPSPLVHFRQRETCHA